MDSVDWQKDMFCTNNSLLEICSLLRSVTFFIQLAIGSGDIHRNLLGKYFIIE